MIIGRKHEKSLLDKVFLSKESEFIVVYGRRRVGKTYLIREFFGKQKCVFLHATGIYLARLKTQLQRFTEGLSTTFFDGAPLNIESWEEGFKLLQQQIAKHTNKK